jgi:hypothetical protein
VSTLTPKQIQDLIFSKHDVTNIKADHMESIAVLYQMSEDGSLIVIETIPLTDVPQEEWKPLFSKERLQEKECEGVLYWQVSHNRIFDEGDVPYLSISDLNYKNDLIVMYTSDSDLSNMKEIFTVESNEWRN